MSGPIDQKKFLIAIHRKLYQLDEKKDAPPIGESRALYEMIKSALGSNDNEWMNHVSTGDLARANQTIDKSNGLGLRIMTWYDDDYPLTNISNAPPILYIRGKLPDERVNPYVAFVGARKSTDFGKEMTTNLVSELAEYDTTIVSGLAYGIDAAAHNTALKYQLPTIAVLGCGIDFPYPAGHSKLSSEISSHGAVVSEFPLGTPPLKQNFPLRNRVISGLSLGVVVVEAEIRSGSLITARWAGEQGKEVFAVPGNARRIQSSGTNKLIKEGAHLIEMGCEIAEFLKLEKKMSGSLKKNCGQVGDDDAIKRAVIKFLNGKIDLEKLVEETGLNATELLPVITEIELL